MSKNIKSAEKKAWQDVLCTPYDCLLALRIGARYQHGHLKAEIDMRRMSRDAANSIYAAAQQMIRVGELMQESNVHLPELIEWLENAKEIRTGIVEPKLETSK